MMTSPEMHRAATPDALPRRAAPDVIVLRYSTDPGAMIAFCRDLGMVPTVSVAGDGFADLVAGAGGRVIVHAASGAVTGAEPGTCDLCLGVEDVRACVRDLVEGAHEAWCWDESYGVQGVLTGPDGEQIALNETQRDLYGYEGGMGDPADAHLAVVAVRASGSFDRDADFFDSIGFDEVGDGDAWWRELRGTPADVEEAGWAGTGIIGLHAPGPEGFDEGDVMRETGTEFGRAAVVRLGFETDEDLEALTARLRGARRDARVVTQGEIAAVHVIDPDGYLVEIHPRPAP